MQTIANNNLGGLVFLANKHLNSQDSFVETVANKLELGSSGFVYTNSRQQVRSWVLKIHLYKQSPTSQNWGPQGSFIQIVANKLEVGSSRFVYTNSRQQVRIGALRIRLYKQSPKSQNSGPQDSFIQIVANKLELGSSGLSSTTWNYHNHRG